MESIFNSSLLVTVSEMGDKTQLLAFMLATRFRRPWIVLLGIAFATILNHLLAASLGSWLQDIIPPNYLRYGLAFTFFAFALWLLIPDKVTEDVPRYRFGPFLTTAFVFFLAEMGDKTQLATVALAARYDSIWAVTLGTTIGMLIADGLAVFFGDRVTRYIPMRMIHFASSLLFVLFGLGILLGMS